MILHCREEGLKIESGKDIVCEDVESGLGLIFRNCPAYVYFHGTMAVIEVVEKSVQGQGPGDVAAKSPGL